MNDDNRSFPLFFDSDLLSSLLSSVHHGASLGVNTVRKQRWQEAERTGKEEIDEVEEVVLFTYQVHEMRWSKGNHLLDAASAPLSKYVY